MEGCTKASGRRITNREKGMKSSATAQSTRGTMSRESQRAAGDTSGTMARFTRVSGLLDSKMDRAFGEGPRGIRTSGSGEREGQTATGFTHGSTEIVTRASSRIV